MIIELQHVKPTYMSDEEIDSSDVYLQESLVFENQKKYLISANSGQGKTSLLNFIYGSSKNFTGTIDYREITDNLSVFELRKTKIAYVFQDLKLFSDLSVFDNIQLKNSLTNHKTKEQIDAWIERTGLGHKRDTQADTLSLGQKQRVAVLRALCQPFEFLLLDEPFSHLDEKNSNILTEIILEELDNQGAGIIVTSLGRASDFNYDSVLNL